jgi:type II secretory pathway pseudopilin PulG
MSNHTSQAQQKMRAQAGLGKGCRNQAAFTLVEMMIVVGIMILILSIGIPSIIQSMKKDVMRQAVSDIVEACSHARASAIINGIPAEVRFNPQERTFSVGVASSPDSMGFSSMPFGGGVREESKSAKPATPNFSGTISDQLVIEMLDVNFVEKKDEEDAKVRFFPNGMSDMFTLVLNWPEKGQWRKISVDIVTGLADMEVIR